MHRETRLIQIAIPLDAQIMGGEQPVSAQQLVTLRDDTGRTVSSVHNSLPLVGADFTPEVLDAVNARLVPLGLAMTAMTALPA